MAGFDFPAFPPVGTLVPGGNNAVYLWEGTKWIPAMQPVPPTVGGPFLPLGGGALTGPLTLYADPTVPLGAATKQYVDTNVLYTATGGTTPRHLVDHLGDQISIRDLGAVGDGVTDDSAAFATAATHTGVVYLPRGTYLLSATLTFVVSTNLSFYGESRDSVTIKFPPSTTLTTHVFNCTVTTATSTFSDITFDLTNITATTGVVAPIRGNGHRVDVKRCAFLHMGLDANFYGIILQGQINGFAIQDNIFSCTHETTGSNVGAIQTGRAVTNICTGGVISGNLATLGGFSVEGKHIKVSRNTFVSCGVRNGTSIYFNGNYNAGLGETAYTWCGNNSAEDNDIYGKVVDTGSIGPGIVNFAPNTTIKGNRVTDCSGTGIISWAPNCSIADNIVYDNGTNIGHGGGAAGIVLGWFDSGTNATGTYVGGNVVYDSGVNFQTMGICEQPFNAGVGAGGANVITATIGNNRVSAPIPSMALVIRSNSVYAMTGIVFQGGTTGGTANAQTVAATNPPILLSSFVAGMTLTVVPSLSNTGAMTLNVQTGIAANITDLYNIAPKMTGAIAVKKRSGAGLADVAANDVVANMPATVVYNGTFWVLSVEDASSTLSALKLGFVGDGVTDNTAAWAAMFALTGSPTVRFPPGVFILSPPVALLLAASNLSIVGSGRNTTIFRYPAGTRPTTHLYSWNTLSGFVLRDFTLDLNGMSSSGGRTGTHGIVFSFAKCRYFSVDSVAIINGFADGGVTDNTFALTHITVSTSTAPSSDFTIRNCLLTLQGPTFAFGRGISMSAASGFPISRGRIENNVLVNTNGIQIDGDYHVVSGNELNGGWCSLDDTGGWLAGHGTTGNSIYIGNHVHDGAVGLNGDGVPSAGFSVSGYGGFYSGNVVERMGGPGFIGFGNNSTFIGNRVIGCGRNSPPRGAYDQAGFRMPSGTVSGWVYGANTTLIGNYCADDGGSTQLYGYYEQAGAAIPGVTLRANSFSGVTAPMFISTTTTVVDNVGGASVVVTGQNPLPAGTSSLTAVMVGLAVQITPKTTGNLDLLLTGITRNNTASNGLVVRFRYGTGTPPAPGAAQAGTGVGSGLQSVNGAGGTPSVPLTLINTISGLVRGTTYWIDVSLTALTGGTAVLTTIDMRVTEQ